jgi:hypothetical protein
MEGGRQGFLFVCRYLPANEKIQTLCAVCVSVVKNKSQENKAKKEERGWPWTWIPSAKR